MKEYKISLATAILMNINIMVGTGILIGPGVLAALAGNASFLCWPFAAIFFLPMVISTVQLNKICPGSGGFYAYAKRGLNETAGYLSGLLYIVGYTFAAAVEVLALHKTISVLVGLDHWLVASPLLFNAVLVGLTVAVNLMSLKFLGRMLNSLTITKIIPLVTLIVLIPLVINPHFSISPTELSLVPLAIFPMAIFGFFGFEYCVSISHLIEDSEKNAPRALMLGFLITACIYTLFHFGALNIMGAENLAKLGAPAFAELLPFVIPGLSLLIALSSVLALFAGTTGMINSNSTLLHSMAEEKLYVGSGVMSMMSSYGRPWVAILVQGLVIFVIATCMPTISIVGGLCNIGVFLAFVLPFVSLLLIKRSMLAKSGSLILTGLALTIALLLALYSWYLLGSTMSERTMFIMPLLGVLVVGYLLRRTK